ncbi:serine/threonine protein phosphatase [Paenibacillus sp. 19GGS1-52]|uniref:metallophosphoesterase family protein n=1 Tax=Paenibacillus sp. 19GGS1-52 TaxID=2758563 RepID=UPI0023BA6E5C|nr:metallophosphoesterase family protein [Paenibacillus sp. 19GGS1-52]ULO10293.1 serine/threonine protein phosphatase [Paenibacillus sp. 19GGS1-52]
MRTLVISDIHGSYQEFNALLNKVNYGSSEDQLILLGDYVDRGPNSKAIVEQVKNLHEECGVVVLKGNHDKMACDALLNEDDKLDTHWLNNGGFHTLLSYIDMESDFSMDDFGWNDYMRMKEFIRHEYKHHLDFLSSLPLYYETEEHIFVHAGINPTAEDWKDQNAYDFIWIRQPFYRNPVTATNKIVVFGHTSTVDLHNSEEIWFSPHGDKIGIDGGCAYGQRLNCLEICDGEYRTHFVRQGER